MKKMSNHIQEFEYRMSAAMVLAGIIEWILRLTFHWHMLGYLGTSAAILGICHFVLMKLHFAYQRRKNQ